MKHQKIKTKNVALYLKNLPFTGRATIITYKIDKDNANSCRYNKRTERNPSETQCGMNGEIDTMVMQAKGEAIKKAKQIVNEHPLLKSRFNEIAVSLISNGRYMTPYGKIITNSHSIDKINNDINVSLEGSKQTREITINQQGTFKDSINIKPNGVVLIEILQGRL
jgi:hypothetical protein